MAYDWPFLWLRGRAIVADFSGGAGVIRCGFIEVGQVTLREQLHVRLTIEELRQVINLFHEARVAVTLDQTLTVYGDREEAAEIRVVRPYPKSMFGLYISKGGKSFDLDPVSWKELQRRLSRHLGRILTEHENRWFVFSSENVAVVARALEIFRSHIAEEGPCPLISQIEVISPTCVRFTSARLTLDGLINKTLGPPLWKLGVDVRACISVEAS